MIKKTLLTLALFVVPMFAHAESIEIIDFNRSIPVTDDFVVGPGRQLVELNPGDTAKFKINVTSRKGAKRKYTLNIEDLRPGSFDHLNTDEPPIYWLGDEDGPYSLRRYISIPNAEFELEHGQRAIIPVSITVPIDSAAGGLYGGIIIALVPEHDGRSDEGVASGPVIEYKIGVPFLVKVLGDIEYDGRLVSFSTRGGEKWFWLKKAESLWDRWKTIKVGPIPFDLLYENHGSTHISPAGSVKMTNLFGTLVDQFPVEKTYVLPQSSRSQEVISTKEFLFGRYTAVADVNLGYGENITRVYSFWVIPLPLVVLIIIAVLILRYIFRWINKNFELKRKER